MGNSNSNDADQPSSANGADEDHTLAEATEAILFAADEPVTPNQIADIFSDVTGRDRPSTEAIESVLRNLNDTYEDTGRVFEVHEWGGGYRLATRSSVSPFVKTLFIDEHETSLSQSLMETLAVVAYRQPVTRPEVDFVRGVNSDYAIRKLLDRGLLDVEGRAESIGRPLLYGTTDRFLEEFGLSDLESLPTLREVEELLDDPAFDEERAQLLRLDAEEDGDLELPAPVGTEESTEKDGEREVGEDPDEGSMDGPSSPPTD
jgi:segregation and condensation protein B